ncbi:hypothetical protein ACET3Z_002513 [Daucus carota]
MECYYKLPVAKRTRSGSDRFIEEEFKRRKSSGRQVAVEADVVAPVVLVEDDDEGLSGNARGRGGDGRECKGKSEKGKEVDKDSDSDCDVIVVGERDLCKDDEDDSDVVEVLAFDKGEEREIERVVDGGGGDDDVEEEERIDSLSSEESSEDTNDESDESFRDEGFVGSDHAESSDDSSSYAKSEDEGDNDSDDGCGTDRRIEGKNGFKRKGREKGKGKFAEGSGRENDRGEKETVDGRFEDKVETFELEESSESDDEDGNSSCHFDDSDEENDSSKSETSVGRKNGKRIVKSGFLKRTQNVADRLRSDALIKSGSKKVSLRKDGSQIQPLVETDDKSRDIYGGNRRKNLKMTTGRNADEDIDPVKAFCAFFAGKREGLKKIEKEEIKHKFWFPEKKPVEKSAFDAELDRLFEDLNTALTCEDIGSTQLEVDNGDHCKMQSDCNRDKHDLVLDEQIGLVCKYCSHVSQEIRHILPTFSTSDPQSRRRRHFVQPECPLFSDYFQGMVSERHDYDDYNTIGSVWDLVPGVRSSMYEHQREGFEFIWKNLAGGIMIDELEKPLSSSGSGCIISHAPGTGKTRLTIVFLQSFMRMYPDSRPVIIAPKSMLLTWEEEFKKWNINIPFHNMDNLEFSGQENSAAVKISRMGGHNRNNKTLARLVKLYSWKRDKSILGITYALFDKLVSAETSNAECDPSEELMGNVLLQLPSIIVLDEGHNPRNDQSRIYNSLLDVETERRIILSGTPFQNNFVELYNTLRLVSPKFDSKSSKFDDTLEKKLRKISKELKSNWSGRKLMELKHMISPFVHVHKGKIIQERCPRLKDALIRLQPTDLQEELIAALKTKDHKNGHFEIAHEISLVSVHPSLLPKQCFRLHQFSSYKDKLQRLKKDPYSGAKTKFVIELCRLSVALKERVLIFGQFIKPLKLIKKQLQSYFGWTEGREVLYMDGKLEAKQRQSSISALNDPRSKSRVLLASIKACSEGIHLVGASRVVLLDVVWNPSVERQAISRAYRIGQTKIVYTYHLIAEDMEVRKYKVQTAKDRLSEMLFSSKDTDSLQKNSPDMVSEDRILQEMYQQNDKLGGLFKQILYQPKESDLIDTFDVVA